MNPIKYILKKNICKLVKIIDAKSKFKCDIIKKFIRENLKTMNIEYIVLNPEKHRLKKTYCENDFERNKPCNIPIKDKFIIEVYNGYEHKKITVGNNCIGTLILEGVISNVNCKKFKYIRKIMKTSNLCIICERTSRKGYHKKCVIGKNSNLNKETYTIVKLKYIITSVIPLYKRNKALKSLFGNITFIKKINFEQRNMNLKTIRSLDKFIEKYKKYIDNANRLLKLKNNCIVKSIKNRTKYPSIKQLAIIDKILEDYDRILKIDIENNKVPNKEYSRYGYIFPNIKRKKR